MNNNNGASATERKSFIIRTLSAIETAGNKLPQPIMLFIYGILLIIGLSVLFSLIGLSVEDPRASGTPGRNAEGLLYTKNLLNADGIRYMLTNLVTNFTTFAPLGTVIIAMLGVGIAEKSGLIEAALKSIVSSSSKRLVTAVVVFAGALSNVASDVGYVMLVPLGAIVFLGFGRHPIAGLAAAFAGVSGGYSANLVIGTLDPLLAGISQEAARFISPAYTVGAEANWYFMFASTFLITIIGTLVTEKIVEPMLGKYKPENEDFKEAVESMSTKLSSLEKKGLRVVGLFILVFAGLLYLSVYSDTGILLNQKTKMMSNSPFFASIIAFVFLFFSIAGIIYGFITKKFDNSKSVIDSMGTTMIGLSSYIVLAFVIAQFINYFGYTNIGLVLAIGLADGIKAIGMHGSLVMTLFIVVAAIINIFIGSASAKWALLAPIFIPMFMLLGFSPEITQVAYRIGDSVTNIITPLNSYFAIILFCAQKYIRNFGIGSMLSLMLPFTIAFLIFWTIMFYVWVFVFGLPVGPGVEVFFKP